MLQSLCLVAAVIQLTALAPPVDVSEQVNELVSSVSRLEATISQLHASNAQLNNELEYMQATCRRPRIGQFRNHRQLKTKSKTLEFKKDVLRAVAEHLDINNFATF